MTTENQSTRSGPPAQATGAAAPCRILAFDCSGASCGAAVLVDGIVVARRFEIMARGQAEVLVPMIAAAMADAGLEFADLDAIATTTGPGSFTGLRIGLATGRGLALAATKPLVAVTSFEAYVEAVVDMGSEDRIAVLIDSRRGPVFAQKFDSQGCAVGEPDSIEPDAVAEWLGPGNAFRLAGDGVPLLPGHEAQPVIPIMPESVARVAAKLFVEGIERPALPLYLRAPDVTLPRGPA